MISKELLSEVLNDYTITNVGKKPDNNDMLYYVFITSNGQYTDNDVEYINVYSLAHKCKEWAYMRGYEIYTSPYSVELSLVNKTKMNGKRCLYRDTADVNSFSITSKHIFKACQWILDNKE